jgi:hypothetical protein
VLRVALTAYTRRRDQRPQPRVVGLRDHNILYSHFALLLFEFAASSGSGTN